MKAIGNGILAFVIAFIAFAGAINPDGSETEKEEVLLVRGVLLLCSLVALAVILITW